MRQVFVVLLAAVLVSLLPLEVATAFTVGLGSVDRSIKFDDGYRTYTRRDREADEWSYSFVSDDYNGVTPISVGVTDVTDSLIPDAGDYDSYSVTFNTDWHYSTIRPTGETRVELYARVVFDEAVNFTMSCTSSDSRGNSSAIYADARIVEYISSSPGIWSTETIARQSCSNDSMTFSGVLQAGSYDLTLYSFALAAGDTSITGDYSGEMTFSAAVPIPAAAWLFGSALAGLGWIRRKKIV